MGPICASQWLWFSIPLRLPFWLLQAFSWIKDDFFILVIEPTFWSSMYLEISTLPKKYMTQNIFSLEKKLHQSLHNYHYQLYFCYNQRNIETKSNSIYVFLEILFYGSPSCLQGQIQPGCSTKVSQAYFFSKCKQYFISFSLRIILDEKMFSNFVCLHHFMTWIREEGGNVFDKLIYPLLISTRLLRVFERL